MLKYTVHVFISVFLVYRIAVEFYKLWFWFGSGTGVEYKASQTGTDFLNSGFFFSIFLSVLQYLVMVHGPDVFLWLRSLDLSWDSSVWLQRMQSWLSGHIPCPGVVYFLFHSAWEPHVNFSGPNSSFIQTHNKRFHLPATQRKIYFFLTYSGLTFTSAHLTSFRKRME